MKIEKIQLGGKEYAVRESSRPLKDCYGYCRAAAREIVISKGLTAHERKLVFVHEALHALCWFLDEEIVDAASKELVEALDKLDLD